MGGNWQHQIAEKMERRKSIENSKTDTHHGPLITLGDTTCSISHAVFSPAALCRHKDKTVSPQPPTWGVQSSNEVLVMTAV